MKIGILSPSEIAFRRFMPAINSCPNIEFAGIAIASKEEWFTNSSNFDYDEVKKTEEEKANKFIENYGGKIYYSYDNMLHDNDIDSIYIPLPPALHGKWGKAALKNGKNAFVEKPSTTSLKETEELVELAKKNNLVVMENYMFIYHKQLEEIMNYIKNGIIGKVKKYTISFGFPRRSTNDFRYQKNLGGGAIIDCGGYTIKYANMILGGNAELKYAKLINDDIKQDIDIFGNGIYTYGKDIVEVQFGMDNDYRCMLEVWGSEGTLKTNRVLTAPAGYIPTLMITKNGVTDEKELSEDDTFFKSIQRFMKCIDNADERNTVYNEILKQASLIDEFRAKAGE